MPHRRGRTELRLRAPLLPGEEPGAKRLAVREGERPDAWWLPGAEPRPVVTTAALRRLKGRQLDAVLLGALAGGFPQVPVFAAFRDEMHRLVELAADDTASRRHGRLTTALALVELNEGRGLFGPSPAPQARVHERVYRLLTPPNRLPRPAGCA